MSRFPYPTAQQFQAMSPDEFEMFWATFVAMGTERTKPFAGRFYIGQHDIRDACCLKRAGWVPEFHTPLSQLMSWYWRRPARTTYRPGMLFKSTSQALSALRREQMEKTAAVSEHVVEYQVLGIKLRATIQAIGQLHANEMADRMNGKLIQP